MLRIVTVCSTVSSTSCSLFMAMANWRFTITGDEGLDFFRLKADRLPDLDERNVALDAPLADTVDSDTKHFSHFLLG